MSHLGRAEASNHPHGAPRQAGFIAGSGSIHAAREHVDGQSAVCGMGGIVRLVPGGFDPKSPYSCRACSAMLGEGADDSA
jgi:hypothetical protein